ncbi:hypothetical protein BJ742DRAFT_346275 [Cladochytrium replicatum]|nr:hypothetical protein BJ742DRAFT_346275 [Cladochytrium replicatum]
MLKSRICFFVRLVVFFPVFDFCPHAKGHFLFSFVHHFLFAFSPAPSFLYFFICFSWRSFFCLFLQAT